MEDDIIKKARAYPSARAKKKISNEQIALSLGWLTGEVSLRQVAYVLYPNRKFTTTLTMYRVALGIKEAYRQGRLYVKD